MIHEVIVSETLKAGDQVQLFVDEVTVLAWCSLGVPRSALRLVILHMLCKQTKFNGKGMKTCCTLNERGFQALGSEFRFYVF